MTQAATTTPTTVAQTLFARVDEIHDSVATLESLARIVAAPREGSESLLQTWTDLLGRLVDGQTQTLASLGSLHRLIQEPGIAAAVRRVVEES